MMSYWCFQRGTGARYVVAVSLAVGVLIAASKSREPATMRASRIELTDSLGRTRIVLDASEPSASSIRIQDPDGVMRYELHAWDTGDLTQVLHCGVGSIESRMGQDGTTEFSASSGPSGPRFVMFGTKYSTSLTLWSHSVPLVDVFASDDGHASLTVRSARDPAQVSIVAGTESRASIRVSDAVGSKPVSPGR